jgi:hypothetical protein
VTKVTTEMASELTRNWIQYLKNNRIAALQSDPKSGKLNYKRKVTADDVRDYLYNTTEFDKKDIDRAIRSVSKKGAEQPGQETPAGANVPAVQGQQGGELDTGMSPGNPAPRLPGPQPTQPTRPPSKYAATNQDATDVEPRYGPRKQLGQPEEEPPKEKPRYKSIGTKDGKPRLKFVREDFNDNPGPELSEKDVETIFKTLSNAGPDSGSDKEVAQKSQIDPQEVKAQEIDKLKKVIAKTMTPEQRKQLWDALKGATLSEAIINKYDTEELFKDVINKSRANVRQSGVTMDQLHAEWKKAGYPGDTDKISELLQGMGFDSSAIDGAINNVMGSDNEDDETPDSSEGRQKSNSEAINKIAAYIQKAGLTDELLQFMQENFGKELTAQPTQSMWQKAKGFGKNLFGKKATNEDVKQIFTLMLKENINIVKTIEYAKLGRNKK